MGIAFIIYFYFYLLRWRPFKSKYLGRLLGRFRKYVRKDRMHNTEGENTENEEDKQQNKTKSVRVVQYSEKRHTGSFPLRLGAVGKWLPFLRFH